MAMIQVTRTVTGPTLEQRAHHLTGPAWRRIVEEVAKNMGDQARNNIIKFGGPGGKWAKLSGFGKAHQSGKAFTRAKVHEGHDAAVAHAKRLSASEKRRANREAKAHTAAGRHDEARQARVRAMGARHSGYARQKETGKTPGHGLHGGDERLRDTDSMFAGMDGAAQFTPNGVEISMVSRGKGAGRDITNDELFRAHATGAGHLPVRDPAEDMSFFEKVTQQMFRAFLDAMPK